MAKRSQRRPLRYEKDQGGCISGLMNIFDFRHGRSSKKLLADRRRGSRQANGVGSSDTRPTVTKSNDKRHNVKEAEKSKTATGDAVKTSVKKLMEEEMIREQVSEKQNVAREGSEDLNPENGNRSKRHHRRRSRTSARSMDMDIYDGGDSRNMEPGNLSQQIFDERIPDNISLETLIKELRRHHRNTDFTRSDLNIDCDMQSDQANNNVQEKLHAAIKVLMSQRLTSNRHSREDGRNHHSTQLKDALQTINSNKELFLKLLQEPNSLLVKHRKGFEGAPLTTDQKSNSFPGSNILEELPTMSEPDEPFSQKHRNFFQRRSKSQDSYSFGGDEIAHSSSKIVILKPGPTGSRGSDNEDNMSTSLHSHFSSEKKVQGDKHASNFSLTEIKRRLKHVIGKEHQVSNSDKTPSRSSSEDQNRGESEKGIGGENLGWSSPNRNHFYTEKFAKPSVGFRRGDKNARSKDHDAAIINDPSGYPNPGASNIYAEAKKHLSEMLNVGEVNVELIMGQLPRSLGRILSLPEYKDSPRCSPEQDKEGNFVTARTRLTPEGSSHWINDSTNQHTQEILDVHEKGQVLDVTYNTSSGVISENSVEETTWSRGEGNLETGKSITIDEEENESSNVLEISSTSSPILEDVQTDIADVCNTEISSQCLELESFEVHRESSPPLASLSCSSVNKKVEDHDKGIEKTDRQSPISVLEPLFSEDDISPARTMQQQELEIHPRKIQFEEQGPVSDQGISILNCMEDGESPFEYVEAVLLGSGLNWDEFLPRWLSSEQILDQSLFDEVELFSSRCHDQKLLFDCTNEVLKEVCNRYFGGFIGISSSRHSIQPAPRGINLIHEIWEGVEQHLVHHPPPKSLDQLVKKDMTKSEMWMKPHLDIEHIGVKIEEAIFEELVEDIISSFLDDSLGCLSGDFPPGSHKIGISIDS